MTTIKKLAQDVVNKIAAGEVIQRPRNVVKELIENCLDAGSKNIQVIVRFSGSDIQMIQIKDDGCGIQMQDLKLACERFCTSKLESFEDLREMKTFGFRGEALASISHVSHVEIITRTKDSPIGFSMTYEEGKPSSEPKATATNPGTIIRVTDLFYNYAQRRNTLKSPQEEYSLILEVVSLYALNNDGITFSLMKSQGEPDVNVNAGHDLVYRIKTIFGCKTASNLVPVSVSNDRPMFSVKGMVGNINSALKSFKYVFFVNNRLVDCFPLKKALDKLYKNLLPKGNCSFVFISLQVDPQSLDVNIHPTKNEVRFLFEDEIITRIVDEVSEILMKDPVSNQVSQGSKQTVNKLNSNVSFIDLNKSRGPSDSFKSDGNRSSFGSTPSRRDGHQIRRDHSDQMIDDLFRRMETSNGCGVEGADKTEVRKILLTSVQSLRKQVVEGMDDKLKKILKECSFVGVSTGIKPLLYIQYQTSLISVQLQRVSQELFYQLYLKFFGNFGQMILEPPLDMTQMLSLHMNRIGMSVDDVSDRLEVVISRREMLLDYFSMEVSESGQILSLPILLEGYSLDWSRVPVFVAELALDVDWKNEKECFLTFGKALASLYSVSTKNVDQEVVSSLMFPQIKQKLRPPASLEDAFTKITDTQTLYKIFHRC